MTGPGPVENRPRAVDKATWWERGLQGLTLVFMLLCATYLLTYTAEQRERADCQEAVDAAMITALTAGREANAVEAAAMDHLVTGLLTPAADAVSLLEDYQDERARARGLRQDNPLPDPRCD